LLRLYRYAPLLVNVNKGASQWSANLIGYDALNSYGSPSYYVQVMFNAHCGDEVLDAPVAPAPELFTSVTRDSRTGVLYLKAVNASETGKVVEIEIDGAQAIRREGKATVLSGKPEDTNSIETPKKVTPVEHPLTHVERHFRYTFAPYSVTVLELSASRPSQR